MASTGDPSFQRSEAVAIVGVGLIGGSIAAALKKRGHTGPIIGVGRSDERLAQARSAGLIDRATREIAEAATQSDLVVFCTPVDQIADGVLAAAKVCRLTTLLTDAGSVKGAICRALAGKLLGLATFIGSHPVAGSEKNGFEHADADLFVGRTCVVTPDASSPIDQLSRLKSFWQFLGAKVVELSPEDHDRALAETSHLPHVIAAALAATLTEEHRSFVGTGFCDTTRIASGDPALWAEIFLANDDDVLARIDAFGDNLRHLRSAIANQDATTLKKLLQVAKTARESADCGNRSRAQD